MFFRHFAMAMVALNLSCSPKVITDSPNAPMEVEGNREAYLIKIADEPVYSEEFLYVLSKNSSFNDENSTPSESELAESFELFLNYKLKVKEAIDRGYHETDEFKEEFNGFKEEITQPYLLENQVQEGEIQKTYERLNEVVKASHILLTFPPNAVHEDSLAVFKMAEKIKSQAEAGEDFGKLAVEHSQDPSVVQNKGSLGYFTAMQMVYPFEAAAYNLSLGEVSSPILTDFGYHIIKLEDRKPNPGEVRVSHLLIRADTSVKGSEESARRKIVEIHQELQRNPELWNELVLNFSEDPGTRSNAGLLPWFGVGAIVPAFEKVAFSLSQKGEISEPVKTDFGYHILRLEDTKPIGSLDEMNGIIKSRILRDSRFKQIQSQVLAMQMAKFKVEEHSDIYEHLEKAIFDAESGEDSLAIERGEWLLRYTGSSDTTITVGAFLDYLSESTNNHYERQKGISPVIDEFIGNLLKEEEERALLRENSEYRLLIQEFKEGILLFSLMNDLVWQKAFEDSLGLQTYFDNHREHYKWKERVEALIVKVTQDKPGKLEELSGYLKSESFRPGLNQEIKERFLQDDPLLFTTEEKTVEWEDHEILKDLDMAMPFQMLKKDDIHYMVLLGEKLPAKHKDLNEIRGKVIQDYQSHLEEKLIDELREKYKIEVDEKEKSKAYQLALR